MIVRGATVSEPAGECQIVEGDSSFQKSQGAQKAQIKIYPPPSFRRPVLAGAVSASPTPPYALALCLPDPLTPSGTPPPRSSHSVSDRRSRPCDRSRHWVCQ